MKSYFKIKKLGTTENAARIQISTSIIPHCLKAIIQRYLYLNRSIYEALQILNVSLTDKMSLPKLLNKTKFNDVKEQFNTLFMGLFD